jgi:DNA-binding GntR family transcriptional regulator
MLSLIPFNPSKGGSVLNLQPLREQIYQYLRREMQEGDLLPGSSIDLNRISQELGVSKTPLRDAIIQLEAKGFVTILPRRGVLVNVLTLRDVKNIYEVLGSLETSVILSVFDRLGEDRLAHMDEINAKYRKASVNGDYEQIYRLNLAFHDTFLELSGNSEMKTLIVPLKQRLYDFPRRAYLSEWELRNAEEHEQFIQAIRNSNINGAQEIWKDLHWSFSYQEGFIRRFYALGVKEYQFEMAQRQARQK